MEWILSEYTESGKFSSSDNSHKRRDDALANMMMFTHVVYA